MGLDRFIRWDEPPEWGPPTIEKLAAVAENYLGSRWKVTVSDPWITCECEDKQTFPLRTERDDLIADGPNMGEKFGEILHADMQQRTRGFEVFFSVKKGKIEQTSVITRQADEFTGNVADGYAKLIARWWNGKVEWPT